MSFDIEFRGELKAGETKQDTVLRLAKFSKSTPEATEKRFFGGTPVKIKQVATLDEAQLFCQKLLSMGVVVHIKSKVIPAEIEVVDVKEDSALTKSKSNGKLKKWIFSSLVVVLIAIGGGFFGLQQWLKPTISPLVIQSENAFYSDSLIALGHINASQIHRIEEVFSNSDPILEQIDVINELQKFDIDVSTQLQDVVFSAHINENNDLYTSAFLVGQFDRKNVELFIDKNYITERDGELILFKKQERLSCEFGTQRALKISKNFILISHPEKIKEIAQRFDIASTVSVLDPNWQAYRSSHLLSIGIFKPADTLSKISGLPGMMLQGAIKNNSDLQSIYFGMKANPLPPNLQLELQLESANKQWLIDTHSTLNESISRIKSESSTAPIIKNLVNGVGQSLSSQYLNLNLDINRSFIQSIKDLVKGGIGSLFSFGGRKGQTSEEVNPEQIDSTPRKFENLAAGYSFANYKPQYGQSVQWTDGPFAVTIGSAYINKQGSLEIEVLLNGNGLANLPNYFYSNLGDFYIDEVIDKNGNNVLRIETCGQQINSEPAPITVEYDQSVKASKKVRINDNVNLLDIKELRGHFEVKIADQINSQIFPAGGNARPLFDKAVVIEHAQKSEVSIQLNSSKHNLLDIRALNDKKQYLVQQGSSFGMQGKKSVSMNVQGSVGFVEVISATSYKDLKQSFTLKSALPSYVEQETQALVKPVAFTQEDWQSMLANAVVFEPEAQKRWQKQSIQRHKFGAFIVDWYPFDFRRWMNSTRITTSAYVYSPYSEVLSAYKSNLEIELTEVQLSNGTNLPVTGSKSFSLSSITIPSDQVAVGIDYPKKANHFTTILRETTELEYQTSSNEDLSGGNAVSRVEGLFRFYAPTNVKGIGIPFRMLGEGISAHDFVLTPVAIEKNKVLLLVKGNYRSIINIHPHSMQFGQMGDMSLIREPTTFDDFFIPDSENTKVIEVNIVNGQPEALMVFYTDDLFEKTFPITIDFDATNTAEQ